MKVIMGCNLLVSNGIMNLYNMKVISMKQLFFIFILTFTLNAQNHKAVFDCSSNNFDHLQSRIALIEKTASMMQVNRDTIDFILLIHSGCTPIAAIIPENLVKASEVGFITNIQSKLEKLHEKYKVNIVLCELAMKNSDIEKDEVLSFIKFSPNSFIDAISLQNRGYAMMSFK